MKPYLLTLLWAAAVAVGLLVGRSWERSQEPHFHGKTAAQWEREMTRSTIHQQARLAELGPILVPYLMQEVDRFGFDRDDILFKAWVRLYTDGPDWLRACLSQPVSQPERRLNAVILLGQIGPEAKGAVPLLTRLLDDDALQGSAIVALSAIGPAAKPAAPRLISLLEKEPHPFVLTALARIGADPEALQPLLYHCRTNGPLWFQREAGRVIRDLSSRDQAKGNVAISN